MYCDSAVVQTSQRHGGNRVPRNLERVCTPRCSAWGSFVGLRYSPDNDVPTGITPLRLRREIEVLHFMSIELSPSKRTPGPQCLSIAPVVASSPRCSSRCPGAERPAALLTAKARQVALDRSSLRGRTGRSLHSRCRLTPADNARGPEPSARPTRSSSCRCRSYNLQSLPSPPPASCGRRGMPGTILARTPCPDYSDELAETICEVIFCAAAVRPSEIPSFYYVNRIRRKSCRDRPPGILKVCRIAHMN